MVIVQHSADRNGSAISGLLLANGLREEGWTTHVVFGHPGPMEDSYRAAGHSTLVLGHKNWLRRSHSARFVKDLLVEWRGTSHFVEAIRPGKPDLVYVNTAVSFVAALAARRLDIPLVWHLREMFVQEGGEMRAPAPIKPMIRHALGKWPDLTICNSSTVAENLLGPRRARRAVVVPNAVADEFFDNPEDPSTARLRLGLSPEGKLIGVPGTLRPAKGHEFFIEAFERAVDRYPEARAVITGDGDSSYKVRLEKLIRERRLQDRVRFLGSISDMPSFYRACDVVCVPSRQETFGRVVIEAFASGVPVVASAVGGILEIIRDGENGVLVPYGDSDQLSNVLCDLVKDREIAENLAEAARRCAQEKYRVEIVQRQLSRLLREVLESD